MIARCSVVTALATVWAFLGLGLAAAVIAGSTDSGRPLVIGATVVGVGAALAAAVSSARGSRHLAGVLLIVSVVIPSSFAYLPNLLALLGGLALILWPDRRQAAHT